MHETEISALIISKEFKKLSELINAEIETNRLRLLNVQTEFEQTRLLAEINAYEKVKSLPLIQLTKLNKKYE